MIKKSHIYVLLLLLIPSFALAQTARRPKFAPSKDHHRNKKDNYDRKQGTWKFYSASRLLIAEIEYLNDKKHGFSRRYYPHTGNAMEEAEYFDGRRHGDYKKFYYTGAERVIGEYDYGKRTGDWTAFYHNTSEVRSEGKYLRGKKDGNWKYYLSNGKLKYTYTYALGIIIAKDGIPVGEEGGKTINLPK
jgi:antitoxin component YwqK of YwqJK toxin-antitoxin module